MTYEVEFTKYLDLIQERITNLRNKQIYNSEEYLQDEDMRVKVLNTLHKINLGLTNIQNQYLISETSFVAQLEKELGKN